MVGALEEPNLYDLAWGQTQVSYSTTSVTGEPQFIYTTSQGTRTFCGNEIETMATGLGEEVTVTLESVPDLRTITLTVLIPATKVAPTGEAVTLSTLGLVTTTTTTTEPHLGVRQTYESMTLEGEALLVPFR
jgi:hypothetical protein